MLTMFLALGMGPAFQTIPTQTVKLDLIPTGFTAIRGNYIPSEIFLTESQPSDATRLPSGLTNSQFGTIYIQDGKSDGENQRFQFVIGNTNGTQHLWMDSNQDGNFLNDPAATWTAMPYVGADHKTKFMGHIGNAKVDIKFNGTSTPCSIGMYEFDPTDTSRPGLKNMALAYPDFGFQGSAKFGSNTYPIYFQDSSLSAPPQTPPKNPMVMKWMLVDRNKDHKNLGMPGTAYQFQQPVNINGSTYQWTGLDYANGAAILKPSIVQVAEIPMPPVLNVGSPAIAFTATTTDGKTVNFPGDYKGKIVLLDFWATWCGPCLGELPFSTAAYAKYHDKGYDVLGVSLDQKDQGPQLASFTQSKNMPWPEIYEGKFWDVSLVKTYGVQGIPFVLLVDGTTGKILATESDLRGDKLDPTIVAALSKLQASK